MVQLHGNPPYIRPAQKELHCGALAQATCSITDLRDVMRIIDRDRWQRLEPMLDQALELSPAEQAAWLQELRTKSPELAADLSELLVSETAADRSGFLAEPLDLPPVPPSLAGLQLGAYTIEHALGAGGMGSVWLARRTDGRFEGRAAVKLLNLSLLSARGQVRFQREGSVLARLTHPGIARLLDAGVSEHGQPYLVLEFIEGRPIDVFLDRRRANVRERVQLVVQLLAALAHAHANLVVHRDIKPSNILVTEDGTPKLLDFGIAKLLASAGDERAALTLAEFRALTPDFAAPEQVRGDAISTATDCYAVGVLLYVLLTGRRPYEVAEASAGELERIICENAPPKPSATFANVTPATIACARARGSTPARLHHQLRGDLDAIVLKALRKEPQRRYASAQVLADDLQRYLDGRPVLARPDHASYRVRKFMARHRWSLAAVAGVILLLASYAVTVTVQSRRIHAALKQATVGATRAEQVSDLMLRMFEASEQGRAFGDTVSARQLLQRGHARAAQLSAQPEVQAQMLAVIGRLHMQLGAYEQAQPVLEQALATRRRVLGEDHPDVAASLRDLAEAIEGRGNSRAAADLYRRALSIRRRTLHDTHPLVLDVLQRLGRTLHKAGDPSARAVVNQWIAALSSLSPDSVPGDQLMSLAVHLDIRGERDRAEQIYRHLLATRRQQFGERDPAVVDVLGSLGSLLTDAEKFEEAEGYLREVVQLRRSLHPSGHPDLARALRDLGLNLQQQERWAEAEPMHREQLALYQRAYGKNHVFVASAYEHLGCALAGRGAYEEAEWSFREALRINRTHFREDHLMVIRDRMYLGNLRRAQGRFAEAEPLLLASYHAFRARRGLGDEPMRYAQRALVRLYEAQGRVAEAAAFRAPE